MPAGHEAQLLWPAVAAILPGLHAVDAVARSRQYEPTGQVMHDVSPLADWYEPAAHAVQMLWPVLAVIVPASHAAAAVAPVGHAEPAGQLVQSLGLVAPVEPR